MNGDDNGLWDAYTPPSCRKVMSDGRFRRAIEEYRAIHNGIDDALQLQRMLVKKESGFISNKKLLLTEI